MGSSPSAFGLPESPLTSVGEVTSFVGRAAEGEAVEQAFAEGARLVALVGPGGMGKTRLAVRYGAAVARRGQAVWFCDLTGAQSLDDAVGAVAAALGVTLAGGDSIDAAIEQLRHAFVARDGALLIMDNVEQVLETFGRVLDAWSPRAGLLLLVTSRVRLGRAGERSVAVDALAPDDAARLFETRAREVAPELRAESSTRELIARLDGNPLAIELAAARSHVLPPSALLARFSQHIDLVRARAGHSSAKHATLRAVVEGSWGLCSPIEQRFLCAFAVFQGGFAMEAAEAVAAHVAPDVEGADIVESLLAKSLLKRSAGQGHALPRYSFYESVRELALEQLASMEGLADIAMRGHADHFTELALRHGPGAAAGAADAIEALVIEAENLIAAFRFRPRGALALDMVLSARLTRAGHEDLLSRAIERAEPDADPGVSGELYLARAFVRGRGSRPRDTLEDVARASKLAGAAKRQDLEAWSRLVAARAHGDLEGLAHAKGQALDAVGYARDTGQVLVLAHALIRLGWSALHAAEIVEVERHADEALAIAKDRGLVIIEGLAHNLLGALAARRGANDLAERHLLLGIAAARASRSAADEVLLLGNLSRLMTQRRAWASAREYVEQALEKARLSGLRRAEGVQLSNLTALLFDEGKLTEAGTAAAHAQSVLEEVGYRRYEAWAWVVRGAVALEEDRLDAAMDAFARGQAMGIEIGDGTLLAPAHAGLAATAARLGDFEQADREMARARTMAEGLTYTEARDIVIAREGFVEAERARRARDAGRSEEAAEAITRAERALVTSTEGAARSSDVRVARRLLERVLRALPDAPPSAPAVAADVPEVELVTRSGVRGMRGDVDISGFDLFFDARKSLVVVGGEREIDLRSKPIAARLLVVLLGEPGARFDKARLFEDVWHAKFRASSQGATLYKAVDRLTRLLDSDPRRFFRWDEEGCLIVIAETPALARLPASPAPSS